jgi:hypothetical protein
MSVNSVFKKSLVPGVSVAELVARWLVVLEVWGSNFSKKSNAYIFSLDIDPKTLKIVNPYQS